MVLCYQKLDWEKFRKLQARVRSRNRPFSNFVDEVRERRQRHGLGGDVCLLLDLEKQSRLDNWIEFQNRHLKRLEQFKEERDKLKQELADAQELAGYRNNTRPKFGPTRAEALKQRLEVIQRNLKWHHVLLQWIEQQRLAMDLVHPAPVREDNENQGAAPKFVRRTSTRGRRNKGKERSSILGNVRVMKSMSKERNKRNTQIQKLTASELEPPIQNLDSTSQASKHPEAKPRRIKIDTPVRQIRPQGVSKATRFAGIKARSPLGPRRRAAEQAHFPDRAHLSTPQRAQSAHTITTRFGRISMPPTRWQSLDSA